ncbi:hypothetical protein [Synechococcus sp. RedBA-s]|uniref:hypothetical protein n=1 Tax=Synechococcus sp. RedBA-s TaxID=2823741 RepID=UPI0020CDC444|nr:hypothetical protein [Synechococcus sp. RedBA-s]MCP9799676.1 hypothetical protein [Synechococcus sp. RedBA-s]
MSTAGREAIGIAFVMVASGGRWIHANHKKAYSDQHSCLFLEQIISTQPESKPAQEPRHDFAVPGKIVSKTNVMFYVQMLIEAALIIPLIG